MAMTCHHYSHWSHEFPMVGTIKYKTIGSNVINKQMHKYPNLGKKISFVESWRKAWPWFWLAHRNIV